MRFIDVYESDNGSEIVLTMDTTLRAVLEENPSTGYNWQMEDKNSSCLEMVSKEFYPKKTHAIGSAGLVVFYFKPVKPGWCRLSLKLWRPWEGDKSIVKRFDSDISIRGRR